MKDIVSQIEESTLKDAQEIINVINLSNRIAFGRIIPKEHFREPVISLEEFEDSLKLMTFYVHRHKGSIVAVAALSIEDEAHGRIRWVYVLPEYQKQGFGTTLVLHIETLARELGLRKIRLMTDSNAEWAIRFYRKIGYVHTNIISNPWGFDIWMEKQL